MLRAKADADAGAAAGPRGHAAYFRRLAGAARGLAAHLLAGALGTYFHSSGALSFAALPAHEWRAVLQSFCPAFAMP
jgi:hypothetical protein